MAKAPKSIISNKYNYKNIAGKAINVNCKKRSIDEIFEEIETQELINLVDNKYLTIVK
jgi:hypothetical protein